MSNINSRRPRLNTLIRVTKEEVSVLSPGIRKSRAIRLRNRTLLPKNHFTQKLWVRIGKNAKGYPMTTLNTQQLISRLPGNKLPWSGNSGLAKEHNSQHTSVRRRALSGWRKDIPRSKIMIVPRNPMRRPRTTWARTLGEFPRGYSPIGMTLNWFSR